MRDLAIAGKLAGEPWVDAPFPPRYVSRSQISR